jgi:hypothetical protein
MTEFVGLVSDDDGIKAISLSVKEAVDGGFERCMLGCN